MVVQAALHTPASARRRRRLRTDFGRGDLVDPGLGCAAVIYHLAICRLESRHKVCTLCNYNLELGAVATPIILTEG